MIETLGKLQDELNRSVNQVNNGIRALEEERMRRAAPAPANPASPPAEKQSEEK